jgi:hypothetical protein
MKETTQEQFWEEPISVYTAEQAVEDGVLVDVSEMGREMGFTWPVRISIGVHSLCTPPKSNTVQSYEGRLWDVLWMAKNAVKRVTDGEQMTTFRVTLGRKLVTLWAMIDGTSGPAIHIITPEDY